MWEEGIIIRICSSIGNREVRIIVCVIVGGGLKELVEYLQGYNETVHKLMLEYSVF